MYIQIQLKDLVKRDDLCEKEGINTYCVNEGADGEDYITIEVEDSFL